MSAQLSDISALLEKGIKDQIMNQLRTKVLTLQLFETNAGITRMDNNSFYIPLQVQRSSGSIALVEGGQLVNGKPGFTQAQISAKMNTSSVRLTQQALSIDAGSVVPVMEAYTKAMVTDFRVNLNRQIHGTSDGKLSTTAGTGTSSTSLVLTAASPDDIDYADYIGNGSYIKITSGGSAVQVTGSTARNTLTLATAQTWSAGANVYVCDAQGNTADDMTGLQTAVSASGTFQTVDPTVYPAWASVSQGSFGSFTQESQLNNVYLKVKVGNGIKHIIMNVTLFGKYANILTSMKRTADTKEVLSGGWKGLDFMGGNADVILDYDCRPDAIYGIDPTSATFGMVKPMEWVNGDTMGKLSRVPGTLDYEAVLTLYGNIGFFTRAANFICTGAS